MFARLTELRFPWKVNNMKFEYKYPDAISSDRYEFEYSYVSKSPKLGQCQRCASFTKWFDVLFQVPVCSEECNSVLWKNYRNDQETQGTFQNFEDHFNKVKEELKLGQNNKDVWKDIIIIVRDQLDYFKQCIESVFKNTTNFHLYIWDNGSQEETKQYIDDLVKNYDPDRDKHYAITTIRSENNTGFIYPNNELVALGSSPYIILLNSDTKVFELWDSTMVSFLKKNESVAQVGYWGGHLDNEGRGFGGSYGFDIDYVPGWCFCVSRETYQKHGLFSDKLKFAYFEDSDYSLRLKEAGKAIYALYAPLVHHFQNKTVINVEKEGTINLRANFEHNQTYVKQRWQSYLNNDRVVLKKKESQIDKQSFIIPCG